jgi:hypothetical protein
MVPSAAFWIDVQRNQGMFHLPGFHHCCGMELQLHYEGASQDISSFVGMLVGCLHVVCQTKSCVTRCCCMLSINQWV